ncbi:hypothetical protein J2X65_002017 [Ancylobacter sp. 3268]|uniref:hypothetical protein n=1 Tax=Ancylobacter sp. 3268 TaxID=2817752 RepID=UPI002858D990|nr:hypothetical protein [Ancylobacter sp. 3268]MDR6952658.1 hypothetical protein [Ancylobacter sp. 3268]
MSSVLASLIYAILATLFCLVISLRPHLRAEDTDRKSGGLLAGVLFAVYLAIWWAVYLAGWVISQAWPGAGVLAANPIALTGLLLALVVIGASVRGIVGVLRHG